MILYRRCLVLIKDRYHKILFGISNPFPNAKTISMQVLKQAFFEKNSSNSHEQGFIKVEF